MRALTKDKAGRSLNKQPARDQAVARFIETVDYRRLEQILASDPRYQTLHQYMGDPLMGYGRGKGKMSLAAVLRKVDIPLAEIQKAYLEGSKQLGLLELANQFPALAADISQDARSRDEACPACAGTGALAGTALTEASDAELDAAQCKQCKGSGLIRVMGDKHARDTIGKWLDLNNDKGVTINNLLNQNSNFGGGQDRIEDLLSRTAQVLQVEAHEVEAE